MDQLAALRGHIDQRAVYDADEHAALHNTAKYADLHDMLWQIFVPERDKTNAQLDFAAKALLYTKFVYDVWVDNRITSCEVGLDYLEHCFDVGQNCLEGKCDWLLRHQNIDNFAAEGTTPCRHVRYHHSLPQKWLPTSEEEPIKTISSLRNLHRLKDAVTLAAYWTIMQDYETLGCLLMRQRLCKATCREVLDTDDLGLLGDIPIACLNTIVDCLDHLNQQA